MLIILWKSCDSHDRKCVKMADLVNFWENRINSFRNLLLQTHQSECYQIWVPTLGQGHDVKSRRSCWSRSRKCVKMADSICLVKLCKFLQKLSSPGPPVIMLPNFGYNIRPGPRLATGPWSIFLWVYQAGRMAKRYAHFPLNCLAWVWILTQWQTVTWCFTGWVTHQCVCYPFDGR